jgi:hypothetical protein
MLIANYKEQNGKTWSFDAPNILYDIDDLESLAKFQEELEESLSTVNPLDKAVIKEIYNILTPPNLIFHNGQKVPWFSKQFNDKPLVGSIAVFTTFKSDVLLAENKAISHIANRLNTPLFDFNKVSPLSFSQSTDVKKGGEMDLLVLLAAYDSTEAMKVNYWIDDSTKSGKGLEYIGPVGSNLSLPTDKPGKHTVYGNIAVKERGIEKWKPWKFEYTVGK